MKSSTLKEKVNLIEKIGVAFHKYGAPAPRLEAALLNIATALGLKGNFFSTPTYLAISIQDGGEQITRHVRVSPGEANLERLHQVDDLATLICNEEMKVLEATEILNQLEYQKPTFGKFSTLAAFSFTSLALALIFGASALDALISLGLGFIVGLLAIWAGSSPKMAEVFEFLAAFLVTFLAYTLNAAIGAFNFNIVIMASLIVIIPGLTITIALTELATKNLVSGTARMMGAITDFFKISFGILLGAQIGTIAFNPFNQAELTALPGWISYIAILMASISFTVIFKARIKDFIWVLMSGVVAIGSLKLCANFLNLNEVISLFVASFLVGFGSNLFARLKNRPAMIPLLPGIIFLVPGSVGFKGLNLIFQQDIIHGIEDGFKMFILAITIVAGLFFANLVLNPRRSL